VESPVLLVSSTSMRWAIPGDRLLPSPAGTGKTGSGLAVVRHSGPPLPIGAPPFTLCVMTRRARDVTGGHPIARVVGEWTR
jgi:hypothetical protein